MKNKSDVQHPKDVRLFVDAFYKKVLQDDLLKEFFSKTKWELHLPIMYTFWENIAFYSGGYSGNPISLHRHIHHLHPLTPAHFEHWIRLFFETVDAYLACSQHGQTTGPKHCGYTQRKYDVITTEHKMFPTDFGD